MSIRHTLRTQKHSQNILGVTLIETVVTILIFVAIVSGVFVGLLYGSDAWQIYSGKAQLQVELQRGRKWLASDIGQATSNSIVNLDIGTSQNSIEFKVPIYNSDGGSIWSKTITYFLGGENQNQLRRAGPHIGLGASLREKHENPLTEVLKLANIFETRDARAQESVVDRSAIKSNIISANVSNLTFSRPVVDLVEVSLTASMSTGRGRSISQYMNFSVPLVNK